MQDAPDMKNALDAAIELARKAYQRAVIELAQSESAKDRSIDDGLADVDQIHRTRTRVIALEAARDELSRISINVE
ncbi:MAG: hypothetical protein ACRYF2_26745 [Janthinobacterium lividum]